MEILNAMDARERLNRMMGRKEAAPPEAASVRERLFRGPAEHVVPHDGLIEQVVRGDEVDTPHGKAWRAVETYGPGLVNGNEPLDAVADLPGHLTALLAGDERLRAIPAERMAFLDTETSGLSGGTGTFAFLVGVGRIARGTFSVRQYVLRDLSEEQALLSAVASELSDCDALVSFNGKCFDVPLLEARLRLARVDLDLVGRAHFDLLFPARRLFRRSLENCRLATIEREVLGVRRGPDVDGSAIPALYFDYLRTRDARPLASVFRHNVQDILSLATLMCRVVRVVEDPLRRAGGAELASVGELHDRLGNSDIALACLEAALAGPLSPEPRRRALERLSLLYKEREEWDEAVAGWTEMAGLPEPGVFPFEELAKYHEHVSRDRAAALRWTERALALTVLSDAEREALAHRRARLSSKPQGPRLF